MRLERVLKGREPLGRAHLYQLERSLRLGRHGMACLVAPGWSRSRAAFVERVVDLTQARIAAPTALTISAIKPVQRADRASSTVWQTLPACPDQQTSTSLPDQSGSGEEKRFRRLIQSARLWRRRR
jgi:hypothetical protein